MDGPAEFLVRWRRVVVLVVLALSCWLIPGAFHLGFDYNVGSFLRTADPALKATVAHYGDGFTWPDRLVFFGFEAVDPLGDAALARLADFEQRLRAIPGIRRVVSLHSAPGLSGASTPPGPRVASSRLYRRLLVHTPAAGGRGALAGFVEIDRPDRADVLRAMEAAARTLPPLTTGERAPCVHLTGFPVLRDTYVRFLEADQRLFLPLAALLTAILLLLLVPGLGLAVATMAVVPLTLGWTFGILGHLGQKLVLLTSTLPTLLMVIAVADAVHLSLRFREERLQGIERDRSAVAALARTWTPCALTSLTTAIGFGSLTLARVRDLVSLGAFSVLGVLLAFLLTILVLPALLPGLARVLGEGGIERIEWSRRLGRFSRRLGALPQRWVLAGAGLAFAGCLALGLQVRQDAHLTEDYFPQTPAVQSLRWFEQRFVGPITGEILVRAKSGDLLRDEHVAELRRFVAWLEQQPGVIRTLSFLDAMDDGVPKPLLSFLTREPVALFDSALETARVLTFTRDVGTAETRRFLDRLDARIAEIDTLEIRPVGLQILATRIVADLINEVKGSFLAAFLLISILMTLVFKSLRYGLIAIVPNLFPLLVTLSFMGATGMRLRILAVITFAIAFGLAVDNTIHILNRFRWERTEGRGVEEAIGVSLEAVGAAVWTTSLLLLLGFGLLLFSNFKASHDFGLLACVTVLAALLGDLILLPALLRTFAK